MSFYILDHPYYVDMHVHKHVCDKYWRINIFNDWPDVVARVCNPATLEAGIRNALRSGGLACNSLCRSGVHTKRGVNVVGTAEAKPTRFAKEECTGSGRKRSKQKLPRGAVVG